MAHSTFPVDLSALESLARAATPGPWTFCGTDTDESECRMEHGPFPERGYSHWTMLRVPDAAYIAAANPATILDLIELVRELEGALSALLEALPVCEVHNGDSAYHPTAHAGTWLDAGRYYYCDECHRPEDMDQAPWAQAVRDAEEVLGQ